MEHWDARWRRTWQDLALPLPESKHASGLADLLARYREPQRHYHTLQHLGESFAVLDSLLHTAAQPGELALALWFHDAIHDVRRHDNEQRSAELALACLAAVGATPPLMRRVWELILATRHHEAASDPDLAILLDADLAILGAPRVRFAEYEDQVRTEYAHVPQDAWAEGRAKVLHRFLARPRIYTTPAIFTRLEDQARTNLRCSLAI
ncbi:hypothetical protein ACFQ09_21655 [Massilia norwichensis]|uniref:N-methyl-D-aspartate receptor NMDAR2C subunit n=1 Tax=Massilia norwichensis TaxID=1442366 RepID=A0ABT2A622_9BURK|nr:hypothetical protein [Massilia norwichensis]MCS0589619.1 hypothetical protein [Massilia norwichensis]